MVMVIVVGAVWGVTNGKEREEIQGIEERRSYEEKACSL